jgi:hypothetical protein
MSAAEYLARQQWNAMQQLENHVLLGEAYWDEGRGARWCIGRAGTNIGKTEIIAGIIGSLVVHGDYDSARFSCYGDRADAWSRLRWMADCTDVDYYVAQKASIGEPRVERHDYDARVARHELIWTIQEKEREDDDVEYIGVLKEALEHVEHREELRQFLSENDEGWDLWEHDFGRVTGWHVVVCHVALNKCAWLLREKYGDEGPPGARRP